MRIIFLLIIISFALSSCGNGALNGKPNNQPNSLTPERFEEFNQRFHSDSSFQMSRIKFPIGGRMSDGFTSFAWTNENWQILKEPVKANDTSREYKHLLQQTDTFVLEKYWIDSSGFRVERRFQLKGGKWFLTYYDDINL